MKRGAPVTPRKLAVAVVFAVVVPVASACTLVVKFHDAPESDDASIDDTRDSGRADTFVPPLTDASNPETAPTNVCAGQPDGTQWGAAATDRCCGGAARNFALEVDNENCGVCGMKCGTGQHCARSIKGYLYCVGCGASGTRINSLCQTNCCSGDHDDSTVFSDPADRDIGVCSASNCMAQCNPSACPTQSHCITPSGLSYVCVYE